MVCHVNTIINQMFSFFIFKFKIIEDIVPTVAAIYHYAKQSGETVGSYRCHNTRGSEERGAQRGSLYRS